MKKIMVVFLILTVSLGSCSNNQKTVIEENLNETFEIFETWVDVQDRFWVFSADGKLKYENYPNDIRVYNFDLNETKLTVKIERGVQVYDISFSSDGKTLFLTGGRNFSSWTIAGPGWSENRLTRK